MLENDTGMKDLVYSLYVVFSLSCRRYRSLSWLTTKVWARAVAGVWSKCWTYRTWFNGDVVKKRLREKMKHSVDMGREQERKYIESSVLLDIVPSAQIPKPSTPRSTSVH